MLAAQVPEDDCQQIDTSAIPVKHTSRVRGPDQWTRPGNDLAARFGRDAAHAEWFCGLWNWLSFASSMGPGCCHDLGTTVAGLGEHHGVAAGGSSSLRWAGRWRWR